MKIRLLDSKDINSCLEISNNNFGKNYLKKADFKLNKTNTILVYSINSKNLGFCIFQTINKYKAQKLTCNKAYLDSEYYHYLKAIVIDNKHHNKGIGTSLLSYLFASSTINFPIISCAWKYKNKINIEKLLLNFNFLKKENVGKIWKDSCNKDFKCISYKHKCVCEAVLFIKNKDQGSSS